VTDKHAIYNSSAGVKVDVRLEPLGQPCACLYAGIQAGDVTIYAPIRPGNLVLVECPDGDLTTPVITKILNSRSSRQPTENGKPIFDNNRLLIHAKNVPIDIRTAGYNGGSPVQVLIEQDGTVTVDATLIKLGGASAQQRVPQGDTQRRALNAFASALKTYVLAIQPTVDSVGLVTPDMVAAIEALMAAEYLSPTTRTK
jgi:hypothetical protein